MDGRGGDGIGSERKGLDRTGRERNGNQTERTMNKEKETMLFPAWKQAVQDFIAEKFEPGDVVTHEWLFEKFGLEKIEPHTLKSKADQIQLAYMTQNQRFQELLLSEYKVLLVSQPGMGYKYVPAVEQAEVSEKAMHKELKKAMRRGLSRLVHTDPRFLDSNQKKEHSDALTRSAALKKMVFKERRKLPWKTEEPEIAQPEVAL